MKNKKIITIVSSILLLSTILTGCGSSVNKNMTVSNDGLQVMGMASTSNSVMDSIFNFNDSSSSSINNDYRYNSKQESEYIDEAVSCDLLI